MRNLLYIVIILISTGCDPSFNLFMSNDTNRMKVVKVKVSERNLPDTDSIKFFNSSEKINWKSYDSAKMSRGIIKDTIDGSYKFEIEPGETTLLQPLTIVTPIQYVVVDNDTTFFYSQDKVSKENKFTKIGQFKFIKRIK